MQISTAPCLLWPAQTAPDGTMPRSHREVMQTRNAADYAAAEQRELQGFKANKVCDLVPAALRLGQGILDSTVVYTKKASLTAPSSTLLIRKLM